MSNADSSVTFQPVPGFPGYLATSDGNIRSRKHPSRNLKPATDKHGRLGVRLLHESGQFKSVRVATAVLTAFKGPRPAGMECCHSDGNLLNNTPENLRWDTKENNRLDNFKNGVWMGPEQKLQCLKMRLFGMKIQTIADRFGVTRSTVSNAIKWAKLSQSL